MGPAIRSPGGVCWHFRRIETIDSLPLRPPAGAHVLTGAGWGFHLPIGAFYQQIIGKSSEK